ncbi:MAG: site-specific DNA-methyltransferase, partial [Euryarchaeota archaeon]|nr:site-specific DNA-methyltransferase [Euryarchaeota archaeon]
MSEVIIRGNRFYDEDCITGAQKYIKDNSVDLIITDPPYGIEADTFQERHYARNGEFVVEGYIEIPKEEYPDFSRRWIEQAERILRPGGSIYIVSGYTNLRDILNALAGTSLEEVNHIIWKYNFGVHTTRKYVSSHYHILYYVKPGGQPTFNTYCRYGPDEETEKGGSANYADREDVWVINREYKPGERKNINELPTELLMKMIQYSSNEGDTVCDLFLGGFSTARVAIGMNRRVIGFEKNKIGFDYHIEEIRGIKPGELLKTLRKPRPGRYTRRGKPWTDDEIE